jgi:dihydropteroate synthase-like protein
MHTLFITGKLAAPALQRVLGELAPKLDFTYDVVVLNISVAALLTPAWVARHLHVPPEVERILVPGSTVGDWDELARATGKYVERGPVDLRDLPEWFGQPRVSAADRYDLEILAEINHAPRLSAAELEAQAAAFVAAGADIIDLGCVPGHTWHDVGDAVKRLRDRGWRVSIDSFNAAEVAAATRAGAELVLSVNHANLAAAPDWGCEVVAIPDQPDQLDTLDDIVATLTAQKVRHRLDPILEPIGLGFAASLGRYLETRRRFPHHEMMMGIGNLTELTEVDSAGVNALLAGFCQEVGIRSVLTTAVANWARDSVRELDVARRVMFHAVTHRVPPKKLDDRLVQLRDRKLRPISDTELADLAARITDPNFRLFAAQGRLHVMNGQMHLIGDDPFLLFDQLHQRQPVTPDHAFYLGYELAKALTALTLGKNYVQDQALNWGLATRAEISHRSRRPAEPSP